jgi:hypothetical protein
MAKNSFSNWGVHISALHFTCLKGQLCCMSYDWLNSFNPSSGEFLTMPLSGLRQIEASVFQNVLARRAFVFVMKVIIGHQNW